MTAQRPGPAITAMWAWDNPVDPARDPRGRAYAPAAADRLAAFARAGGLREVYLPCPSGAADGPVDAWLREAVSALHDAGVVVSAVADVRGATPRWAGTVPDVAAFDRLQVAVHPWTPPADHPAAAEVARSLADALGAVTAAAALPVDVCVPWWLATADDGGSLLDPVLPSVDRVALTAPAAHAEGPGGVLDRAAAGVAAVVGAGRPFTVGVRTDTPGAAGGAEHTFFEAGPVAFIRECGTVAAALADVPGFGGVAVEGHRAWRRLLGV